MSIAIGRQYCARCEAETLHRGAFCVHCGPTVVKRHKRAKRLRRPYSVEFRGELVTLKEIAKRSGIAYETITFRFRNGLRGEALVARVPSNRARPKFPRAA